MFVDDLGDNLKTRLKRTKEAGHFAYALFLGLSFFVSGCEIIGGSQKTEEFDSKNVEASATTQSIICPSRPENPVTLRAFSLSAGESPKLLIDEVKNLENAAIVFQPNGSNLKNHRDLIQARCLSPVMILDPLAAIRNDILTYIAEAKPSFVFIGKNIDFHFASNPSAFAQWVDSYKTAYIAIKDASPETLVGTIFQYEHLAGFGGNAREIQAAHWGALEAFNMDTVDVVGLTLFPFLHHDLPSRVPNDYLEPLLRRTVDKPLAIIETGWPAGTQQKEVRTLASVTDDGAETEARWKEGEELQVEYAPLPRIWAGSRPIVLLGWRAMRPNRPQSGDWLEKLLDTVSLKDVSGQRRPVYDVWLAQ